MSGVHTSTTKHSVQGCPSTRARKGRTSRHSGASCQARLATATEGASAREAAAARAHDGAAAALGRELGSACERVAALTAELEQVRRPAPPPPPPLRARHGPGTATSRTLRTAQGASRLVPRRPRRAPHVACEPSWVPGSPHRQ